MIGIELVKSQETREPNPEARDKVIENAFQKGLLILGCGASTVRLMPPLIIEPEQADTALDILERCLSEVEQ
jgi:4-aminobutyrate aminotransferase